ncbi:DUF6461 domain-containing protein [Lentzea californiensis]|uniref:DUF6461 domain-containing protein n=1 Tax=Lentzea californiensis TaxID=438851 RepID=UPI0021660C40|nr:DUF6461 domain-containing protein [Lentzea californiensis]MCR3753784.1 hypothetical protein [Lentzea californiensis]
MQQHDLSWADAGHSDPAFLGEIFSLAFVREVDPPEALRRVRDLEAVSAFALDEWTVLVQPNSFWLETVVDALSRGTEACAVVRHDFAAPRFAHAVDGTVTTFFNLNYPESRGGTDPDGLLPLIREAGFDLAADDDDDDESWRHRYQGAVARGMRLAGLITGVLPTYEQVSASSPGTDAAYPA